MLGDLTGDAEREALCVRIAIDRPRPGDQQGRGAGLSGVCTGEGAGEPQVPGRKGHLLFAHRGSSVSLTSGTVAAIRVGSLSGSPTVLLSAAAALGCASV